MLDLGQRINESIDNEDIGMQYGYQSIQDVYMRMVLLILDNQKKANLFLESDLEKLADFISGSIFLNKGWMEAAAVDDIKQRLQEVCEYTASEHIKNKYNILLQDL
jgi:hypothetical protein